MTRFVYSTNQIQGTGNDVLTSSTLVELAIQRNFKVAHSLFRMGGMELHTVCEGFHALFCFVEGLLARFNLQEAAPADLASMCNVRTRAVEMSPLNNGRTIAEFAETDFCSDNIFFEDLSWGSVSVSCSAMAGGHCLELEEAYRSASAANHITRRGIFFDLGWPWTCWTSVRHRGGGRAAWMFAA
jgi:hypothetical protein